MFRYTALGDSITAGELATSPVKAYPYLVLSEVTEWKRTTGLFDVLAEPGWSSTALLYALMENPPEVLAASHAVSIFVGGDNLAYAGLAMYRGAPKRVIQSAIEHYAKDMARMVRFIHSVSQAKVVLCTQYNPFPNTPMAEEAIGALNEVTAGIAGRTGAFLAPVHTWFAGRQGELIAGFQTGRLEDVLRSPILPIHPNNMGHRVIARGLAPIVARP